MQSKPFWASKTFLGLLGTAIFIGLDAFGYQAFTSEAEVNSLITTIGETIGLVVAAYGRAVASKSITLR